MQNALTENVVLSSISEMRFGPKLKALFHFLISLFTEPGRETREPFKGMPGKLKTLLRKGARDE